MKIVGRHIESDEPVLVEIKGPQICAVTPCDVSPEGLPWLLPGFVDLQVNGFGGQEFNDPDLTLDAVCQDNAALHACGVTSYCPTVTTHSFAVLSQCLAVLGAAHHDDQLGRSLVGIHLEGPYISCEDGPRGAHPREHCRPPDWEEFQRLQDAAQGHLRILTLSPEYDGSAEFITRVVESGVLVAIGHTAATSEQIRSAVDAGARLSTHLGNGAHGQIRRHPNYIWDQLAEDRLMASLIADGHHLPPAVLKSFVRAKTPQRCILVSDVTGMAGMLPGRYANSALGDVEVLDDGRLVVAGQRQYLAGAALPIGVGIMTMMRCAEVTLSEAVAMATRRPAELLGTQVGGLEVGSMANLVSVSLPDGPGGELEILGTLLRGDVVHGKFETLT